MKSSLKAFVLVSGLLLTARSAPAQNAQWTGSATPPDNQFSNGLNWDSGAEPTSTATIATTATVDLPNVSTTISGDLVVTGSVVINATTAGFTAATLQVNDSGTLTLVIANGGTVSFGTTAISSFIGGVQQGGQQGTSGVLNLTGGGTLLFSTGNDSPAVGVGGIGTVNQTNGVFEADEGLFIGGDAGTVVPSQGTSPGTGVYNISGSTSTLTTNFLAVGVGSTIGGTGPTSGTVNINGGNVNITGDVEIGYNDVSNTGSITNTTGAIAQTSGTFTVTGEMDIGENKGSVASYSISGGTFTGATVIVADQAGSTGTFSQSGGSVTAHTLTIGDTGTATASFTAGQLVITTGGSLVLASAAGSNAVMTQTNGTLTLNGTAAFDVGDSGTATYSQQGGLVTANGAVEIGAFTGNGTYNLSGGTLTTNSTLSIGVGTGGATFNYSGGTLNYTDGLEVGPTGTFNLSTTFTPVNTAGTQMVLDTGAVFNLNSGANLVIGGDMGTPLSSGIFANTGATFNFAGGTVTPTGSDWTDHSNGSVTGNSTIDTTNNNAVLEGNLTGNGMITITGTHEVDLDLAFGNSSAASFGFHVESGTLSANAATFPSSGGIIVDATGTVMMADSGTNALSGGISGAGNFNVNFTAAGDELELTGPIALTGVTTLTGGGTLEALNGSFQDIGGAGNLIVGDGTSGGTVNINGTAGYSGNTTINTNATLLANNITSTGIVTNNGILGSNAPITTTIGATTLNIGGSYAASTGTLDIRMASFGGGVVNTDVIAIATTANVAGTTFDIVNPQIANGTFTILTSGGLSGAGGIIQPDSNLFLNEHIAQNGNDLQLTTITNTSASIAGLNLTPNEQGRGHDARLDHHQQLGPLAHPVPELSPRCSTGSAPRARAPRSSPSTTSSSRRRACSTRRPSPMSTPPSS